MQYSYTFVVRDACMAGRARVGVAGDVHVFGCMQCRCRLAVRVLVHAVDQAQPHSLRTVLETPRTILAPRTYPQFGGNEDRRLVTLVAVSGQY